jgi:hypothetical protein
MTNTNTTAATFNQGDVVTYEDTMNFETYVVLHYDANRIWDRYALCNVRTHEVIRSDMAHRGWRHA